MERIDITEIEGYEYIRKLLEFTYDKWEEVYLVGGAIRDYYLNRSSCDLDFVVPWKEDFLARRFANSIGGKFFILGDKERVARVILKNKEKVWKFDFTTFRGEDIYDDLEKRDFTINALAVSIFDSKLIDIFNGLSDIKRRILNPITKNIFLDDPLRIMRVFRFAYSLSFLVSDTLYELIERDRKLLRNVSGERIRDEFFEILNVPAFPLALKELYERKVLEVIFPSLIYDYELCKRCKLVIEDEFSIRFNMYKEELHDYLYRETSVGRKKKDILKLSLIFLFSHASMYEDYLERLRLTRNETKSVLGIIKQTKRFLQREEVSLSTLFSMPLYLQDELPGIAILVYLFDELSLSFKILDIYYHKLLPGRSLPRFIDGNTLQEKWKISQGPMIKEILDKVRIAQIEGKISKKEDAYKFVDEILKE